MQAQPSQTAEPEQKAVLYVLAAQIDTKVLARGETPNSREARLLAKLTEDRSQGFYEKVQTRVLFGEQASRANILKGFAWLQTNMRDQDVAVVFIAGHGSYDEIHHLYAYHPVGGPIRAAEFRRAFNSIRGRKVLLLQTCHASGVLETAAGDRPFRKTMVICACDNDEEATKLMGRQMILGLANMAAEPNGIITTQSLARWIELRVPFISKGSQQVQISRPPLFSDFPLVTKGEQIDPSQTGRF
jgi:hypothetical protein